MPQLPLDAIIPAEISFKVSAAHAYVPRVKRESGALPLPQGWHKAWTAPATVSEGMHTRPL